MKKPLLIACGVVVLIIAICVFLFSIDKLLYSKISCKFGSQSHCSTINQAGNLHVLNSEFNEAEKLFKFTCNSDFYESCLNLGSLFVQTNNISKAKEYFKKSCDGGVIEACDDLSFVYMNENNYKEAVPFLEISCENGFLQSCDNLGLLYFNGGGVSKDTKKAIEFYTKSCKGGYYDSCAVLSLIFLSGKEVERNLPLALEFAKIACDGGVKEICPKIQDLQEAVDSTKLLDNLKSLDKELCEEGDEEACDRLEYEKTRFGK